ncbi:MAG: TRAP-type mannitol/chloroaromatic compound transport system permease large subunit, partial [Rhodothermales bacterium]
MGWFEIIVLASVFVFLLLAGVPISYGIALATVATMLISIPLMPALTTEVQRLATGLDSFALLAIPFFILAGQLMSRGGMARRLIALARSILGGLPGGLAHVNILASMLFGAVSGSAVAAASAVGTVMTPEMELE